MPLTTRGIALMAAYTFRNANRPAVYFMALVTSSPAPTVATKTLSELTEIAPGNGYSSGGYPLTPGHTDFPSIAEDDTAGHTTWFMKSISWTGQGGIIPPSGDPARYVVLTSDEATFGNRQILWYQSLGQSRVITLGATLQLDGVKAIIRGGSLIKSVQRGTITLANGVFTNTATITTVDTTKAVLHHLGQDGTGSSTDNEARVTFTNSTTITATRGSAAGQVVVGFEVEESF